MGSPLAVVQHRLFPVQFYHHARLVTGGQRVLELLAYALRHTSSTVGYSFQLL